MANGTCMSDTISECLLDIQKDCFEDIDDQCGDSDKPCKEEAEEDCLSPEVFDGHRGSCESEVQEECGKTTWKLAKLWGGRDTESEGEIDINSGFHFRSSLFFNFALPPIIFLSGYDLERELFAKHLTVIFLHGVVGTLMSVTVISFGINLLLSDYVPVPDQLALGTVLSSSDTVAVTSLLDSQKQPLLFSVVIGEGIFNDIMCIFLLETLHQLDASELANFSASVAGIALGRLVLMSLVSIGLGLASGILFMLTFRFTLSSSHVTADFIIVCALAFAYASYLGAELAGASGVAAIFVSGATMVSAVNTFRFLLSSELRPIPFPYPHFGVFLFEELHAEAFAGKS